MMTGALRIAVIGDVGGHADQLDDALLELGADPRAGTLPDALAQTWVRLIPTRPRAGS